MVELEDFVPWDPGAFLSLWVLDHTYCPGLALPLVMQALERRQVVMVGDLLVNCIYKDRIPPRLSLLSEVALAGELIVALPKAFSDGCPEVEKAEEHGGERMH